MHCVRYDDLGKESKSSTNGSKLGFSRLAQT